jgi:taurine transport system permease protein
MLRGDATRLWLGSISVGCMLLAWLALAQTRLVPPDLLPGPGAVLLALHDILQHGYRGTTLGQDILATLGRCLGGFALATLAGVPLGLWMGTNRIAAAAIDYVIQFLRPLPPLSYMILLILWLGTGNESKTALLFLTAFPIITSAAMAGVRGVRQQRVQAALTLGATRAQIFRHVILPSALPMIFTGLRIALAAAFSTVVAAELMAATDGLGWMVISASHFLRGDVIILGILLLGLLGIALSRALMLADRHLVHWRGRD